jgi:hypothetical protein
MIITIPADAKLRGKVCRRAGDPNAQVLATLSKDITAFNEAVLGRRKTDLATVKEGAKRLESADLNAPPVAFLRCRNWLRKREGNWMSGPSRNQPRSGTCAELFPSCKRILRKC